MEAMPGMVDVDEEYVRKQEEEEAAEGDDVLMSLVLLLMLVMLSAYALSALVTSLLSIDCCRPYGIIAGLSRYLC